MTGNRGIIESRASAGRASAAALVAAFLRGFNGSGPLCSVVGSPGLEVEMMPRRTSPDRGYLDQQAKLRTDAARSAVLDSRIEIWSERCGVDPVARRRALQLGYSVCFQLENNGARYIAHVIRPDQVR